MSDKPRGRPPLVAGEESVPVTARISASDFDSACRYADRKRISISEAIRTALKRVLGEDAAAE